MPPYIIFFYFQNAYESYDGFVVLHGTDTLAYTASALSFMFENLGKTVIVTGSQVMYRKISRNDDDIYLSYIMPIRGVIDISREKF